MANFISSITLQFRDLFSQGMGQARTSIMELQSSLNALNPAGLASLSTVAIDIPAPEIGRPIIPIPGNPRIDIPIPEIGQPDIPAPENPSIDIPIPEIGRSVIPTPDNPSIDIPIPEIGRPVILTPENPRIDIPIPEIGRSVIPTPDNPRIDIPVPEIGRSVIPTPDNPRIDIPVPEIGRSVIPTPDNPSIDIPIPEIGRPVIPTPDNPSIDIPVPEIGQPIIPIPDNPPITIPTPDIPQSTIPAPDVSLFTQGLNEIQAGLDKIAENNALTTLATQLSVMNTAMLPIQQSLNSILEQPSKLAGSFESSMKNIQVLTGNTNEDMAILNQQLLEIGKTAVAGPQGVVDAMSDIAGGVDNAESHLGILNGAILLAEAGQADLGVAANGLVSIMNAYSLASGDAARATAHAVVVSDVLTQTVGQGVGSMEAFIGAFSQVSGLSASVGVGFDEVGSALAFITTQGPSAAEAATQLKAAETALLNPNKTLSEALQSIGIASGSAMLAEYGLVESLNIVRQSVGGSQDAMAKALGSTEALNGATALLGSGYSDFAATFGSALESGVTAEAAAIQNQSYESKLARMEAATQVLQLQIGDNINAIKGNFVELGTGFLVNVVSPIMSSPLGGVFQEVAAIVGVTGQGLLSFGGTALTTATQFTTLAANIKNAGGYAKIFHGTMTIMQAPFSAVGGMAKGFITNLFGIGAASISAAGGTTAMGVASGASAAPIGVATVATGGLGIAFNSLLWPILAVVAAVGLIAGGAYLLIKNWDSVSAFFINLWDTITGAFSAGWEWIKGGVMQFIDWISPMIEVILTPFRAIGDGIGHIIDTVVGWFGKATDTENEAVKNIQTDLAKNTVPRTINTATETGTWVASSVPVAPESRMSIAAPDTKAAGVAMPDLGTSIQAVPIPELGSAITIPNLANTGTAIEVPGLANTGMAIEVPAQQIAPQTITATAAASGNSLAMEHIEAAQRKGIATSDSSYTASSAFENAGAYTPPITTLDLPQVTMTATSIPFLESLPAMTPAPQVDIPDIDHEARVTFAEAMPYQKEALAPPWNQPTEQREEKAGVRHYHIEKVVLNADDCFKLFEILRQIEMVAEQPEEEVV